VARTQRQHDRQAATSHRRGRRESGSPCSAVAASGQARRRLARVAGSQRITAARVHPPCCWPWASDELPLRSKASFGSGGGGRAAKPPQENDAPSYPSPAEEGKAPLPPWLFSNSRICMPRIIKLIIKL
jgi:hypothetical protein